MRVCSESRSSNEWVIANVKLMTMDLYRKRSGSAVLNAGNRIIFRLFERKDMFKNEEEGKLGYISGFYEVATQTFQ